MCLKVIDNNTLSDIIKLHLISAYMRFAYVEVYFSKTSSLLVFALYMNNYVINTYNNSTFN